MNRETRIHGNSHLRVLVLAMVLAVSAMGLWAGAAFGYVGPLSTPLAELPRYVPNQVLITLRPGRTEVDLAAFNARYGSTARKLNISGDLGNVYCVRLPDTMSASSFMAQRYRVIRQYPAIQRIEYNYCLYPLDTPNDEYYEDQWALQPDLTDPTIEHIHAPEAWDIQKGSDQVVVAVIDTGVRTSDMETDDDPPVIIRIPHPDLADRLVGGYDFAGDTLDDLDDADSDPSPSEDEDINGRYPSTVTHGTHVAGIIGAQADNDIGIAGLCWNNVWILPLKVFPDDSSSAPLSHVIEAIDYCIGWRAYLDGETLKVNVINLSLGGYGYLSIERAAIRRAVASGIVVVAAAGNYWGSGPYPPLYPAAFDEAMCVGATGTDDLITYFSCRGRAVDIAAPGEDILSTVWYLADVTVGEEEEEEEEEEEDPWPPDEYGNSFDMMSGTSMASPHVAAAAALLISHGAPAKDVKALLYETATPTGLGRPNETYGWGLLNIEEALKKASIDVEIQAPGSGATVTTARPTFRIDFRHAAKDTIEVYIDDVLVIGPEAMSPELGYIGEFDDTDPDNVAGRYYFNMDEAAGKAYLLFEYSVDSELAAPNGTHDIYVYAESDVETDVPLVDTLTDEETVYFKIQPQTLSQGWHMFSSPYSLDSSVSPEDVLLTSDGVTTASGRLARWHYADSSTGEYAIYDLDGSPAEEEASFAPPSVSDNMLAYSITSSEANPPAGVGYWLYVGEANGIPVPEVVGESVDGAPYVIGLYYGWNMVGDPFPFPVEWSNAVVEYGGTRLSAAEAVRSGWLSNYIFCYDSTYRRYTWKTASTGVLIPWEAQWVRVPVRGPEGWPEPDLKIIVPPNAYTGVLR